MLLKEFKLCHWVAQSGENSGSYETIDCLIDNEELKAMKANQPNKLIEVIVNDGEKKYIQFTDINHITEER